MAVSPVDQYIIERLGAASTVLAFGTCYEGLAAALPAGVVRGASDLAQAARVLEETPSASVDAVVVANFLGDFTGSEETAAFLDQLRARLAPGGALYLLEVNGRYAGKARWDYAGCTRSAGRLLSHRSLRDALTAARFAIDEITPRFVPLSDDGFLTQWCAHSEWAGKLFGRRLWAVARPGNEPARVNAEKVSAAEQDVWHFGLLFVLLAFALACRLYDVTAPPFDHQTWRQTQTLMIARNFARGSMNLLRPEVDWRATTEAAPHGVVGGTELQVVPWLTALLYRCFGRGDWAGRAVPIFFSILGFFYYHRLASRIVGPRGASADTLLLAVAPMFLFFGRVQMPESFAFAMSFAALYYFDVWTDERRRGVFALAAIACALTLLGKPQMGLIAIPMAYLAVCAFGRRTWAEPRLYLFAGLVGVPVAAFMWYSYHVLTGEAGLSFAQPGLLAYHALRDPAYHLVIWRRVFTQVLGPVLSLAAVAGLFLGGRGRRSLFPYFWALGSTALFFVMPGGSHANGYYELVVAPPACLFAGRLFETLWRHPFAKFATVPLFLCVLVQSIGIASPFYKDEIAGAACGKWVNENLPSDARVLTSTDSPGTLYFCDRIGWICWYEDYGRPISFTPQLVDKVRALGASAVAVPDGPNFDNPTFARYKDIRERLYDSYFSYHGKGFVVFHLLRRADLSLPRSGEVTFGTEETRKYLRGPWSLNRRHPMAETYVSSQCRVGETEWNPPSCSLRFSAPKPLKRITLKLAATVPNTPARIRLDARPATVTALPRPGVFESVVVEVPSDVDWRVLHDLFIETDGGPVAAPINLYALYADAAADK